MAPLKKGILIIDGDRTAGTKERGIGGGSSGYSARTPLVDRGNMVSHFLPQLRYFKL